jgi:hypothetical protein
MKILNSRLFIFDFVNAEPRKWENDQAVEYFASGSLIYSGKTEIKSRHSYKSKF